MSRRFHLSPQPPKSRCTPLWIPILIGIVIGLGLGLLLNLTGVIRCSSCSADQCSAKTDDRTEHAMQRELLGSMAVESETAQNEITEPVVSDTETVSEAVEDVSAEPVITEKVQEENVRDPNQPIRLQVLNGCGEKGIANRVSPTLRRMGFDVRESRNAKNFRHKTSKVYDRSGNIALAYQVANAVGIDSTLVDELLDENLVDIDVTIVIGADYNALNLGTKE